MVGVRGVAVLLGLAVACFSLHAISLDPAIFRHLQLDPATFLSLFPSPFITALKLLAVLAGVVYLALAVGRCLRHGSYHQLLVAVIVSFALLCFAGLVATFFVIAVALRAHV